MQIYKRSLSSNLTAKYLSPSVTTLVLGSMVALLGCNKKDAASDNKNESRSIAEIRQDSGASPILQSQNSHVQKAHFESADSSQDIKTHQILKENDIDLVGKMAPDDAVKFANELEQLVDQANQLQMENRFSEAASQWKLIESTLGKQYGTDSWQTVNARYSGNFATRLAEFDTDQRRIFDELKQKKQSVEKWVEQDQYSQAIPLAEECAKITAYLFGEESVWHGKMHQQISELALGRDWQIVERAAQQALSIYKKCYDTVHPDFEAALLLIAKSNQATQPVHVTIQSLQELIGVSKQLWGSESEQFAARLHDLGTLQHSAKQLPLAKQNLTRAESIRRKILGKNHIDRARTVRNLAVVALDQKQLVEAEVGFKEAKAIFEANLGASHQHTIDASKKLAVVYLISKSNIKAEVELTFVRDQIEIALGNRHTEFAQACFELAIALGNQGKFPQAKTMLEKALLIHVNEFGPSHQKTQQTQSVLNSVNQRLDASSQLR